MAGHDNWFELDFTREAASCRLDFSTFKEMSLSDAIGDAIDKIKFDFRGRKFFVGLSGGLDSEFVASELLKAGVDFTPVIVDYGSNGAEVWNAYYWCRMADIKPMVLRLSESHMLGLLPHLARKHNTAYVSAIDFIIDGAIGIDGAVITGCPEPFVREVCLEDRLSNVASQDLFVYSYDFPLDSSFPGKHPGAFLSYTPSLFAGLIRDLDYSKPIQLALSDIYGLRARPKIHTAINLAPFISASSSTNVAVKLFKLPLGTADSLLNTARNRLTISTKSDGLG